jgi:Flp pilus assembly protein TadG
MSVQRSTQSTSQLRHLVSRLARCTRGVAAIEFGMIVPIMFMLFVGAVEFSLAITVDRRVTQVAASTADLVSRQTTVTDTQVDGLFQIIQQLMSPYSSGTPLKLNVVSVGADPGNASLVRVCWSRNGPNGGANSYSDGASYAGLPAGILTAGTSVIVAEVKYDYQPLIVSPISYFVTSNIVMSETFYLKPRLSSEVVNVTNTSSPRHCF